MMGHGSPRLQDGQDQGQGQSHNGEEGQRSTEGQSSDLDSQTRRLVAQVQASLDEGQRLGPTTVVPATSTTVTPGVLHTPGGPTMPPQEYQIYTVEQVPPAATASSSYGGESEAQLDRVNKHSGHTVRQAQTRSSDEQASRYHYAQQQQQQQHQGYLQQQQQSDLSSNVSQHIVHDYSTKRLHAPTSSAAAQQTVYPSQPQQQQQQQHGDMDTSERHQGTRMSHDISYSQQTQGKPWMYQQVHGHISGRNWSGQMPKNGHFQPNGSRLQGGEEEPERQYQGHMPQKNGSGTIQMSSLLQRRISRTEFVHMYSSDDRYPNAPPHPHQSVAPTSVRYSQGYPQDPELLPEKLDSPISYVSEWLHSSTVLGEEGGYGTPTTADMERDTSCFVYPPPSKLLTDSTPRQHHEEVCVSHQEEDSNVIRSFLHEQQQGMKYQRPNPSSVQLAYDRSEYSKLAPAVDSRKSLHEETMRSQPHGQFKQTEVAQQERNVTTIPPPDHFAEQFLSDNSQVPQISKQEQAILITPQITLEQCEPMVTQLEHSTETPPSVKADSETQQLPVRNLKISSPKSTHAARRASSPVVSKPTVPFFWHFNPKQQGSGGKAHMLSVKEQTWRRYSDSNIPMEPEDLRIKPAIRSKSTGDSTSYEEECLSSHVQADSNLLSVAACKTTAAYGATKEHQQQVPDDKSIITKRLKLKTYLQNRYEADKEEEPTAWEAEQMRLSTNTPELARMSVSQTSGSQRSLSLQSQSERKVSPSIHHPGGSLDEGLLRSTIMRQHESPEKTHLTRAIQSWSLPHPITIKIEPVSPFPSEDDPETPGSVFTPGINVPATPTSFFSPGVPSTSAAGPRQVFSFNVPTCREMSPPNYRAPRRGLVPMYYRQHEKSSSMSALTEKSLPPPPSHSSHVSLPTTHHDQRHHSDTVIYTEYKPSVRDDIDKPKDQPVDMRRSPPGGRKQPPPPLQLAAGLSAFNHMEDQPMPSPGAHMLPPPSTGAQQPHISEFSAASAPPAGLHSPAFPFSTLPSHLHSHPGSSGYPMLSPGSMTWSAPSSAALLPQQSPRRASGSVSVGAGATGGMDVTHPVGDAPQRIMHPTATMPHQQHSQHSPPQIVYPQHTQHPKGRKGQQNLSKLTLTSMAAIQQLREQQLREGTLMRDPNLTYRCPVCKQLFPSYNYLANHMVNHLPSETVIKGPGENKLHLCKVFSC